MKTDPPQAAVCLCPIGDGAADMVQPIRREIKAMLQLPVFSRTLLADLRFALDPAREQFHSTAIIERLAAGRPAGALKVLALTDVDLFIPILTHVYGEAQLGGRAAVVSTYRLREGLNPSIDRALYRQRVVKEALHELGHTFNLRHCKDPTCIMHYCRSIRDVDCKNDRFCRYCDILIADEILRLTTPGADRR